jgi:hypothetical protein
MRLSQCDELTRPYPAYTTRLSRPATSRRLLPSRVTRLLTRYEVKRDNFKMKRAVNRAD